MQEKNILNPSHAAQTAASLLYESPCAETRGRSINPAFLLTSPPFLLQLFYESTWFLCFISQETRLSPHPLTTFTSVLLFMQTPSPRCFERHTDDICSARFSTENDSCFPSFPNLTRFSFDMTLSPPHPGQMSLNCYHMIIYGN